MDIFHMLDIIPLIGLPYPKPGSVSYNVPCPCCDTDPKQKHLNINLKKDVFRCPRCGFSGGIFDLYACYTGIPHDQVREALIAGLNVEGNPIKAQNHPIPEEVAECPLIDIDTRSQTYESLLCKLSLASDHRENLRNRGLTDEAIEKLEYRTTPVFGQTAIAKQMVNEGFYLSGIPGFFKTKGGAWTFTHESRGILIPVRDEHSRIQGLQIRRDNVCRRKFRWVSSVGKIDGCKAEGWVHLAGDPASEIILTEGPMKADVIHFLTGLTVLAVPGVNNLSHLETMLRTLKESGMQKIMTAFDMDFLNNPHVQNGYKNLIAMLNQFEIPFGSYVWNPQYKGLDDYIWQYLIPSKQTDR